MMERVHMRTLTGDEMLVVYGGSRCECKDGSNSHKKHEKSKDKHKKHCDSTHNKKPHCV